MEGGDAPWQLTLHVTKPMSISRKTPASGRPLIAPHRANRKPADQHSATGADRRDHQRERCEIQDRSIRVRVQSVWQVEDVLDNESDERFWVLFPSFTSLG